MLDNRRLILGVIVAALVPAFAGTHVVVAQYKNRRQQLAEAWRARGEREAPGSPAAAVVDFRTSLSFVNSSAVRQRLAEALTAWGRPAEARAQLLTLWTEEPGNGQINLELARLAAAEGNIQDATRYYHAAIDGAWQSDATAERRQAHLELALLLLSKGRSAAAQAELIPLADDLPPDPGMLTRVGRLLLTAGADRRALDLLNRAVRLNPADGEAARLAGSIDFRQGDYGEAVHAFDIAEAQGALLTEDRAMRDVSHRVLALDPQTRATNARGRAARVLEGLTIARVRLVRCLAGSAAAGSDAAARVGNVAARFNAAGTPRVISLEHDSDLREETMSLVFEVADLPATACGPPSTDEQALQLLAAGRRGASR